MPFFKARLLEKSLTPSASRTGLWALLREPGRVPLVMGIVNVTPDSFYAPSRVSGPREAADRVLRQVEEGADLVDIGGQSTRPGSDPVGEEDEIRRVLPVFERLAGRAGVPLCVDTDKAHVARQCLAAGASIVNDVSAMRCDERMAEVAQDAEAVILMHRGGTSSKTMQNSPRYKDVVSEVRSFLAKRRETFRRAGGDAARLLYDPGIGFGKGLDHNLALLREIDIFSDLGPVVLGCSRKSFLGGITPDQGPRDRLEGSLAVACWAALRGVNILRVHDVRATKRALAALGAVLGAS